MNSPTTGDAGYVVGAYAASPTVSAQDPEVAATYVAALLADPRVVALETPWAGPQPAQDQGSVSARLATDTVFTDIPRLASTLRDDPNYGLAADDASGRARALQDAIRLHDDVHRLHDETGRRTVQVIELHSGPRASQGSAESLARSLEELAGWDWEGAQLVIEHCDALVPEHAPEKGFLTLPHEIDAIRASSADVGIWLNWGRSAIELRDADRVTDHVTFARESGLLRGLMFSGASDRDGAYPAWADAHARFRRAPEHPRGDPDSFLTEDRARAAIQAAGPGIRLGVKMTWPAGEPGTVEDRVAMIHDALDALDRVRNA